MMTGMYAANCGNCGHDKFKVYAPHPRIIRTALLVIECLECQATTDITIPKPELSIDFAEGSNGCIYFDKDSLV